MSFSQLKLFYHKKTPNKMGFLCEKGNIGYGKNVGCAIKDVGLCLDLQRICHAPPEKSLDLGLLIPVSSLSSPAPLPWEI